MKDRQQKTGGSGKRGRGAGRYLATVAETLLIVLVGGVLFLGLQGPHPLGSGIRDYIVANGSRETGALNLVTSIYLGYRAFDTLGETIVLMLAVSGVLFFTGKGDEKD